MKNLKDLFKIIPINKSKIFVGVLFSSVGTVLSFFIPFFAKGLIDQSLSTKNILTIIFVILFS